MTTLDLINEHPFLDGLSRDWLDKMSLQARRANYHRGHRLFAEGGKAEHFWLVRSGIVTLDITIPGRGDVVVETIGPGTVLGWSWLFPPYRWHFGAVAAEHTLTIRFDAEGVRRLCGNDPALGYELSQRFMSIVVQRLQATRVRMLDMYALAESGGGIPSLAPVAIPSPGDELQPAPPAGEPA